MVARPFMSVGISGLLALIGCGCLFDPPPGKPRPCPDCEYPDPISPENVLINLQRAYENRDIEAYARVLHSEYVFKPSPFEQLPFQSLNRDEDMASTRRMFENVDDVEMRLAFQPEPLPSDLEDYPAEDGYVMIVISGVYINVLSHNRDPRSNEPITYRVPGDPAKVVFHRDSSHVPALYAISYLADGASGS